MTMMKTTVVVQNISDHRLWIAKDAVAAGSRTVCALGLIALLHAFVQLPIQPQIGSDACGRQHAPDQQLNTVSRGM
jgi:hypothetical protein